MQKSAAIVDDKGLHHQPTIVWQSGAWADIFVLWSAVLALTLGHQKMHF